MQEMKAMIRQVQHLTGKLKAASGWIKSTVGDHYTVPVGEYPAIKVNIKTVQSAGYQPEGTEEGFII